MNLFPQTPGKTSLGSTLAAVTGMIGVVAPFIPPQWQWIASLVAGVTGTLATKLD